MRRFTFDEDFSEPEDEAEGGGRTPAPAEQAGQGQGTAGEADEGAEVEEAQAGGGYTEEDLDEARRMGLTTGREEGAREARRETERMQADALEAIESRMRDMADRQVAMAQEATDAAVELARAVTRKMVPVQARHGACDEVEAVVRECLPEIVAEPRLTVRVAESITEAVRTRINDRAERVGFEGKVVVIDEPEMAEGDARVEWESGGVERDQARTWEAINAIIDRHLHTRHTAGHGEETADSGGGAAAGTDGGGEAAEAPVEQAAEDTAAG